MEAVEVRVVETTLDKIKKFVAILGLIVVISMVTYGFVTNGFSKIAYKQFSIEFNKDENKTDVNYTKNGLDIEIVAQSYDEAKYSFDNFYTQIFPHAENRAIVLSDGRILCDSRRLDKKRYLSIYEKKEDKIYMAIAEITDDKDIEKIKTALKSFRYTTKG